jgi:hypothetical protein
LFGSRICCSASGRPCITGEQCCSGGCDFDIDLNRRICG